MTLVESNRRGRALRKGILLLQRTVDGALDAGVACNLPVSCHNWIMFNSKAERFF